LCRRIFAGKFEEETVAVAGRAAPGAAVYFFCVYFSPETVTAAADDQKTIGAAAGVATSNPRIDRKSQC
jgi:hypothetical protein